MTTYSKETALYDTGKIGNDIDEAGNTADRYITAVDSNGIKVHAENNPSSNYSLINANGMTVYKGGNDVASFGDTARVGKANDCRIEVSSSQISLHTSTKEVAKFENITSALGDYAELNIYGADDAKLDLFPAGIEIYDTDGTSMARYGSDFIRWGAGSSSTIYKSSNTTISIAGNVTASGTITAESHSSPIGTRVAAGPTTKNSTTSGSWVTGASIDLTKGTWAIHAHAAFASNTSGRRAIQLLKDSTEYTYTLVNRAPTSGADTNMITDYFTTLDGNATISVRHWQNGGSLKVVSYICAVRIA